MTPTTKPLHHPPRAIRASSGMTLVEMLISIMIISLITIVVTNLFISANRFSSDEQIRIDVGESAGRLLGPLDTIVREGKAVLASAIVDGVTYTTDHDTLVFSLPSIDGGGSTIPTMDDTAVITLDTSVTDNTRIRLIVDPLDATFRPSQNGAVLDHVKDLYIRYTTSVPTEAQALTLTIQTTKDLPTRSFTRANILYAVFRNHP